MKKMKQLALALLLSVSWLANAQVTTSTLSGKVMGGNEPQMGAAVIATHTATGTIYGATCNEDGNFTMQGLKPGGPYTIEITFLGYKPLKYDNIYLNLGETKRINAEMKEDAQALGEVVVTSSSTDRFNSQKTGAATNFSRDKMDQIPMVSRSISDITKLTPQATPSSAGGLSFSGANNRYNSFQIDGSMNNDVFGLSSGGTNGGQAGANPISLDAIQEIQVVIAPFDVRQSGFTGGGINAITKSGTNEFHGSAYGYFNNQSLARKTILNQDIGDQSSQTTGLTLGGPIVKNKLFFFVNAEGVKETYPSSYNVNNGSNVTEAEAKQIADKLNSLSGGTYDGGGYTGQDIPTTSTKLLGRLDWNINSKNKASLRYSYVDASKLSYYNSNNKLRFNDNGFYYKSTTQSLVGELNSTLSDKWYNELRISYNGVTDHREPEGSPFPYIKINLSNSRTVEVGTERYSAANSLDQKIWEFTDNATWSKGNHTFTFGTHNELFDMTNLFIANNYGSYVYNSMNDFMLVGTPGEVAPQTYDYSYSRQDVTGSTRWAPSFKAMQLGLYAQDEWEVNSQLHLTYGLRMDIPIFMDKPSANPIFNESSIAKQYDVATNQMPKTTPLFSPRLGFRWQPDADKTSTVRGGVGIFTGRIPFVWLSNSFSNTGVEYNRTGLTGPQMSTAMADGFKFQANPDNQYYDKSTPSSEIDVVDKNFKFPQVFRINLAYDKDFGNGFKGTLEGLYSKTLNNIMFQNLIVQESGKYLNNGGDKRPIYETVNDPDAGGKPYSNEYTRVIYLTNTSKGYSYSMTAKLEKDFKFGLNTMIAYTYGRSKGLNDGTSSQANSNWAYNENHQGPNNPELSYTDFDVPHHIVASISYKKEYAKHFGTTVGLIYTGLSGANYSLVYNGNMNNDRTYGNDLIYIPTDNELASMQFQDITNSSTGAVITSGAQQRADFGEWINSQDKLEDNKGHYSERNSMRTPFGNHFDFHIAQDYYFNVGGKRNTIQLSFDILNLSNMLNADWGRFYQSGGSNSSYQPIAVKGVDANNVPTFQFTKPKGDLYSVDTYNSRWRAQVGLRYIF